MGEFGNGLVFLAVPIFAVLIIFIYSSKTIDGEISYLRERVKKLESDTIKDYINLNDKILLIMEYLNVEKEVIQQKTILVKKKK